ncbi:NAD(P)/FAD-dependent oxidoreductase [Geobacter sp. AOG1]|uniref:NAD(P)/FAD-dependent oxidoreductase n=1 Tax=Geobacter sp. AOG1 TaxID=1566346 RepID=UPI001CC70BD1|nr:NAD(P)/FAD-dependent oxidoreductase [Geobacter sp. AOG1]GFE58799.1 geranylgeranyl reductase [Geobacter sp. AOG1]
METCDVLIVGGGPAGSTCAGKLRQAGLDVLLLDKAEFPRDKPCAGWITPAVLTTLAIDQEDYCRGRVLQEISSFRTGLMDGVEVVIPYGKTVSYGIRRCEFDQYLLQRSAVRQELGTPVTTLARYDGGWLVNGRIRARLVVGAGGHHCPVARLLGAKIGREDVIVAQAVEFAMSQEQERLCRVPVDTPALFFSRDMKGYGWLFRKGRFLNIGLGRMDRQHLSRHTRDFCTFLVQRGYLTTGVAGGFQGHAYLVYQRQGGRTCVGDGALLIGDAAGLAQPQSGEGILPAIESALLAADTILAAKGDYRSVNLEPYAARLATRFGSGSMKIPSTRLSSGVLRFLGARLLSSNWFARHVVLDRWFLHTWQETLRSH